MRDKPVDVLPPVSLAIIVSILAIIAYDFAKTEKFYLSFDKINTVYDACLGHHYTKYQCDNLRMILSKTEYIVSVPRAKHGDMVK